MNTTNKIVSNIVFALVILGTIATSAYAGTQLIKSFPQVKTAMKQAKTFDSSKSGIALASDGNQNANSNGGTDNNGNGTGSTTTNTNQCLIAVNGKTYDVYPLKSTHSGGDVFVCNTDMTNTFSSMHGSNWGLISKYLVSNTVSLGNTKTQTPSNGSTSNSQKPKTTSTSTSNTTSSGMTLTQLAKHNTASSCYVAYNGTVYSVTNNLAWGGCTHHGVRGGIDITSLFPHPTSYLSTLPVVGKLSNSNNTNSNSGSSNNTGAKSTDGNDDESKESGKEQENENEHEWEFEFEN